MKIGIASVMILVLIVAGAALIYQRYKGLSRSGDTKGKSLGTERMMELEALTTQA